MRDKLDAEPDALDAHAEALAIAALDEYQRSIRANFHPPGVDLDEVVRLARRAMIGRAENMRRHSHPGHRSHRHSTETR
jgi:hypothetical protein